MFDSLGEAAATGWYLGLDLGTTGISAVLLRRDRYELHPIYWLVPGDGKQAAPLNVDPSAERWFRLPVQVQLDTATTEPAITRLLPWEAEPLELPGQPQPLQLQTVRPYLNRCIPYYSLASLQWEPLIQWTDTIALPLLTLRNALEELVKILRPSRGDGGQSNSIAFAAVGLEDTETQSALEQLVGVVLGYPAHWSDAYLSNVRQLVLATGLVEQTHQILVVPEAIAVLLSELPNAEGRLPLSPQRLAKTTPPSELSWHGVTLVLSAGASVTDLALATVPHSPSHLTQETCHCRTINYAGTAIDQDIICQLIYPLSTSEVGRSSTADTDSSPLSPTEAQWRWQTTETSPWQALQLDRLTLPSPGEPDLAKRHQLQQRLLSSAFGQGLLQAAEQLKLALQHTDQFVIEVGAQRWTIGREDLGSRVFLPYIQRLNRELNAGLTQHHVSILDVNQVICTGGTASLGAIARWLRQKLPNATILQDTYRATQPPCLPTCSRLAYGLAALPLHPQLMESPRQVYSDYQLLLALLQAFPDHPLTLDEMIPRLQQQGMAVPMQRSRLVALLEGHLPPGLVPTEPDFLAPPSLTNPDYQKILAAPLFHKINPQTYQLNPSQRQYVRQYLETLMVQPQLPSPSHRSTPMSPG